jgi:hypothetical protein
MRHPRSKRIEFDSVSPLSNSEFRASLERKILSWLCSQRNAEGAASQVRQKLAAYAWSDADNRVVFESLTRLASGLTPAELREQLPAQATRMGFPDVNWENYWGRSETAEQHIREMVEQLLARD